MLRVAPLEVRFTLAVDRWVHEVAGCGGDSMWRSLEGSADGDERWPRSPAFVEVTRLGPGDDAAVLAVGQAGRSHFSAVILPDPAIPGSVRFDVAARVHDEPEGLGSTYESIGPGAVGTIVTVKPGGGSAGSGPRTARWCYRVNARGIEPLDGATLVPPARDDDAGAPSA